MVVHDLIESLRTLGLGITEAKVLDILQAHEEPVSQLDIEMELRIHQSAASIAIKNLSKRGWVRNEGTQKTELGRPVALYRSTKSWREIALDLEDYIHNITKRLKGANLMISDGGKR